MTQTRKAVFLDRDGTLIVDRNYLSDPDAIEILPGTVEGLLLLQRAGFELLLVTNQSGIARGLIPWRSLHEIHLRLLAFFREQSIQIRGIYTAPHAADSHHPDRKPNPGMLLRAARVHGVRLDQSWMLGDRPSDLEAGQRAGTSTLLITPNFTVHDAALRIVAGKSGSDSV